jgi:hypothetical protein
VETHDLLAIRGGRGAAAFLDDVRQSFDKIVIADPVLGNRRERRTSQFRKGYRFEDDPQFPVLIHDPALGKLPICQKQHQHLLFQNVQHDAKWGPSLCRRQFIGTVHGQPRLSLLCCQARVDRFQNRRLFFRNCDPLCAEPDASTMVIQTAIRPPDLNQHHVCASKEKGSPGDAQP